MPHDINSIRRTTEKGIPDLADKIVSGMVNEVEAINALFMGLRPLLEDELKKRRADEVLWLDASNSKDLKKLKDYVENYDNEAPEYKGRHIDEANSLISLIESDDAEWNDAKSKDNTSAYRHYLDIFDKPAPSYRGKHVESAKQKIEELLPPPPPDPSVEDDNAWKEAERINILDGYRHYLSLYKNHADEAELAIRHLTDERAWGEAKGAGTIASFKKYLSICEANEYSGYVWAHVDAAKTQIGNLQKAEEAKRQEEERKNRIAEENAAWANASQLNTKHGYEEYLAKYRTGGLHVREAENAILKLQSEEDWEKACTENTLIAYRKFVDKYEPMSDKYLSTHLPEAKKKIKELTPDPTPIKWKKWLLIVLTLALCWFLWIQRQDDAWPFNIFQGESDEQEEQKEQNEQNKTQPDSVHELINILQWAIEHRDIPTLTKYAELDSIRAYYPLAMALNEQDSAANVEKTLHWLDLVLDPDVNSLHQCIINDIQEKELNELEARFNAVNPNEKDAEREYLEIYKDYVTHFERLASHTPRVIVQCTTIEDMATTQINDRLKHEELRTSILREWENQQTKLQTVLSSIKDNAKKAYMPVE